MKELEYNSLLPKFRWIKADVIKKTFDITTQMGRIPAREQLYRQYRSPNPAPTIHRRDKPVATGTIFSNTPAVDDGLTMAGIFTDMIGMEMDEQFVNTFEELIRKGEHP